MNSVRDEVTLREQTEEKSKTVWEEERFRVPGIVLGAVIYAVGINVFLRPLHLYSGGLMGFSQLFVTLLTRYTGVRTGSIDLAGIIYYLLNLPGIILAARYMKRRFVAKTIIAISVITVLLTIIPIPAAPVLEEKIANCLIAGIMAGVGIGLVLRTGASDGGVTLIGMIAIQNGARMSVGKINTGVNVVLYGICLLLFDIPTVIYSLIYSVINSVACDRVHTQNINVQVMMITKLEDTVPLEIEIMGAMHRGLTRMSATGRYTGENESVFIMIVNKYELHKLLSIIKEYDPAAFLVVDEGIRVEGHFLKKLV